MPALTTAQLDMIANAALDFYLNRGEAFQQTIQARPLLAAMEKGAKNMPGGKGNISVAVQGVYGNGGTNDSLVGYTADDTVTFYNPTNLDRLNFAWREHHIGMSVTHTELKHDGITVVNTLDGSSTAEKAGRDQTMLVNLFETKLFDFGERYARSLNSLVWGDGTGDAKALHGLQHFLVADPSIGTVGGKNRATAANAYLRNRARTAAFGTKVTGTPALGVHGGGAVTSNPANGGALWQVLQAEKRQLTRYGGMPNKFFAGSDFIGALEIEMRANGYYSQTGFKSARDGAMGPVLFDGVTVEYDPTLDDLGLAKRGYWFDTRHIMLMKMTGEWRRTHSPARPIDKFVLYRSVTSTGQMVATQLNSGLVIDIT
jgi:hypothetical protein